MSREGAIDQQQHDYKQSDTRYAFVSQFKEVETSAERRSQKERFSYVEKALRAIHTEAIRNDAITIDTHYGTWRDNTETIERLWDDDRIDPVLMKVLRPIEELVLSVQEYKEERELFMKSLERNFGTGWKARLIQMKETRIGENQRVQMIWSWLGGIFNLINERHSSYLTAQEALSRRGFYYDNANRNPGAKGAKINSKKDTPSDRSERTGALAAADKGSYNDGFKDGSAEGRRKALEESNTIFKEIVQGSIDRCKKECKGKLIEIFNELNNENKWGLNSIRNVEKVAEKTAPEITKFLARCILAIPEDKKSEQADAEQENNKDTSPPPLKYKKS